MRWLGLLSGALGGSRRRRSPFNNLDASGDLTCGRVTPQLWVGGELGPRDWSALQAQGVSVVVNLQHEQQDIFSPDEKIAGYLWLPAPDGMAPTIEQLVQGVTFIQACVKNGQKVFVHCKAGQGRAPLLCACYLIGEGLLPLEAIKQVREARPRTLLTPDQSTQLREFAKHFARRAKQSTPLAMSRPEPSLSAPPPAQSTLNASHAHSGAQNGATQNGVVQNGTSGTAVSGSTPATAHTPT